jgi:glycosyltransferase involved in cell wall biosynthesis
MKNYKKRKNQKIIHTCHGVTYNFFKTHLERFSFFSKLFLSILLVFSYVIEKPPVKKADTFICVSERVRRELKVLYKTKRDMVVLRTGVDLKDFYPRNKEATRKKINLEENKIYGLYVGRGGYWRKGLDRAVRISEEIYKKNANYKLIVIGAEYKKVKKVIDNKKSLIYLESIPREVIPLYYSSSDFSFCLSRYEGGAPTLVTSETMASECLLVCSKDSEQEIVEDGKNCLILENFDENDAERIIEILKNKKKKSKIIKNAKETIKKISVEKWGEKYLDILMKEAA